VKYHPAHVSRILKDLDWTPQKPIRRAKQRKEAEIQRWKEERWPELKKRPPQKGERLSS
jgi:transposase